MSTLTYKRQKVSHADEQEIPKKAKSRREDNEFKSGEDAENAPKSDKLSSTVSQDNLETSRAAGLVRSRK